MKPPWDDLLKMVLPRAFDTYLVQSEFLGAKLMSLIMIYFFLSSMEFMQVFLGVSYIKKLNSVIRTKSNSNEI